jgi:hypothetical protein
MKNLSTFILIFFITTVVRSQGVEQIIQQQYIHYSQLIIDQKIDEALNYTNEDVFEIIPRD